MPLAHPSPGSEVLFMNTIAFPTSCDIYLEVEGKKVAVVQSYTAQSTRKSINVEAFGETDPVATIGGGDSHTITLTRLYATDEAIADGICFHDLDDFSLVVVKPGRRVIYSGCRWSSISESGELGAMVLEKVTLIAAKRVEVAG
jgi:hypothetical protein